MDCSKITEGFVGGACGALPTGGTGTKVWLFNYDDIDRSNVTTNDDGDITVMAVKTSKKGVIFETVDNANLGEATFNKGTYVDTYNHAVTLRVFKDDTEAKAWVNKLKGARVVAFVERKCIASCDNHIEVYGWDSGMKMSDNPYSTTFTDNVAMAPKLETDDISKEMQLPRTYLGTEEALNALCQSASN